MQAMAGQVEREIPAIQGGKLVLVLVDYKAYQTASVRLLSQLVNSKKECGIYITVNRPYANLVSNFNDNGVDASKLFFIDCVTQPAGGNPERKENCLFIGSPSRLSDLGLALDEVITSFKQPSKFLVLDSVSTLLVYHSPETTLRFAHFLAGRLRVHGFDGIFLTVQDDTDEKLVKIMSQFCDSVIRWS